MSKMWWKRGVTTFSYVAPVMVCSVKNVVEKRGHHVFLCGSCNGMLSQKYGRKEDRFNTQLETKRQNNEQT